MEPRGLGDEAFLRRIHYKIAVPNPERAEYDRIFRSCCDDLGISFEDEAVEYLFREFYGKRGIEPRRCHPRDVLRHLRNLAEYLRRPPELTPELLEAACHSCFTPSA